MVVKRSVRTKCESISVNWQPGSSAGSSGTVRCHGLRENTAGFAQKSATLETIESTSGFDGCAVFNAPTVSAAGAGSTRP